MQPQGTSRGAHGPTGPSGGRPRTRTPDQRCGTCATSGRSRLLWGRACTAPPPCDIPSGCCSFTGPWTVTRSSLRMLRRVAAFCRPLRPVLLLVSFPRSRSPVVGVLGLCWMWRDVPCACQRRPIVGVSPPPPPGAHRTALGPLRRGIVPCHSCPAVLRIVHTAFIGRWFIGFPHKACVYVRVKGM